MLKTSDGNSKSRFPVAMSTPAVWDTCTTSVLWQSPKRSDGETKRGFKLLVGGGLGAVPHQAKVFDEFLPEEELLPISQAISKVFSRLGERKNRNKARMKFVIGETWD